MTLARLAVLVSVVISSISAKNTHLLIANNDIDGFTFLYTIVYPNGTHTSNQWSVLTSHLKTDFDYDFQSKYLFWTSFEDTKIYRSNIPSNIDLSSDVVTLNAETILDTGDNLTYIRGMAVDWINKRIYFTTKGRDGGSSGVHVTDYSGSVMKTLFSSDVLTPESITVDPEDGLMYWTDSGTRKIEQATMDGKQRTTLVSSELIWPIGIAIDKKEKRVYWTGYGKIESVDIDGGNRILLTEDSDFIEKLATTEFHVYAISNINNRLCRINKKSGEKFIVPLGNIHLPKAIRVYGQQAQGHRVCGVMTDNCRHLCLPSNNQQHSCHCENITEECVSYSDNLTTTTATVTTDSMDWTTPTTDSMDWTTQTTDSMDWTTQTNDSMDWTTQTNDSIDLTTQSVDTATVISSDLPTTFKDIDQTASTRNKNPERQLSHDAALPTEERRESHDDYLAGYPESITVFHTSRNEETSLSNGEDWKGSQSCTFSLKSAVACTRLVFRHLVALHPKKLIIYEKQLCHFTILLLYKYFIVNYGFGHCILLYHFEKNFFVKSLSYTAVYLIIGQYSI